MIRGRGKTISDLLLCGALLIALSACAVKQRPTAVPHPVPQPQTRPARPHHVDEKAQQRYYDLGLEHYSRDNYREARDAFQHVVDLGPNTPLAAKAEENLKKIEQIMKTLEEMQSK
jgi:TolA-binding protein